MKKYIAIKDEGIAVGYNVTPDNNYIQAILSIAKKQGVTITDKMVQEEIKKKKPEEQPDAWDTEKRKKLLKALEKVKGIWADDKDFEKRQKERDTIEIAAAKEMRKAW